MPGHGILHLTDEGGAIRQISEPESDPYWPAYARAMREGWS
jgi:hypothetical protein